MVDFKPRDDQESGRAFRLSEFSIRYPVTICMVLVSFLLLGIVSIFKIPLVLFPSINAPEIVVVVPYPNSTPEQIQESITRPLEEALSTFPYVERITSWSNADQAVVQLSFPWDKDVDILRSEARELVERARVDLPDDVDRILVQNFSTNDIPIIEGRIASHQDLRGAYEMLEARIKKPLENVPGVAEVNIGGVEPREVDIYLKLDAIKRYSVDVDALFARLDSANLNLTLGKLNDSDNRYRVISKGAVASLEQLRAFPINERGLTLGEIATVVLREPDPAMGRHLNGEFAIALEVRKASDANTVDTVNRVMTRIEELNNDPVLEGIEVLVWHNAGHEITKSLSGLLNAGLVGAGLAVVVLFLFLRRIGATLLIGLAIPFSVISAIGFLYLLGYDLNVLSMMGLMLATGMLVDNAVVVLESIFQRLEKGDDRVTASCVGTQEVIRAVVAATLTSVIIFVPLVFGQETNLTIFLAQTGVAIMITLFCSLFISLTLIPMGAGKVLSGAVVRREDWMVRRLRGLAQRWRSWRGRGAAAVPSPGIVDRYLQTMSWTLRHRYLVGLVVVPVVVVVSFYVLMQLPDSSYDAEEMTDLQIQYEFTENYHYAKIEQDFINPVESYLQANQESFNIKDVYSYYANNEAATRIYFDKDNIRLEDLREIRRKIADGLPVIPGAQIRLGNQEGGESELDRHQSLRGRSGPSDGPGSRSPSKAAAVRPVLGNPYGIGQRPAGSSTGPGSPAGPSLQRVSPVGLEHSGHRPAGKGNSRLPDERRGSEYLGQATAGRPGGSAGSGIDGGRRRSQRGADSALPGGGTEDRPDPRSHPAGGSPDLHGYVVQFLGRAGRGREKAGPGNPGQHGIPGWLQLELWLLHPEGR